MTPEDAARLAEIEEARQVVNSCTQRRERAEAERQKKLEIVDCGICGGTGEVERPLLRPIPHVRKETCPTCRGRRQIVLEPQVKLRVVQSREERMARAVLRLAAEVRELRGVVGSLQREGGGHESR